METGLYTPCYILSLHYSKPQTSMFICFQCHLTAILPESASSGSPNLWKTSVQTVKSRNGNAQFNLLLHRSQGPPAAKQPAFQITHTRRELKLVLADWSVTSISAQDWSVPFAEISDKALKSLMTPNLIPVHCFPGLVLLCLSLILVTRRQLPTDKTQPSEPTDCTYLGHVPSPLEKQVNK